MLCNTYDTFGNSLMKMDIAVVPFFFLVNFIAFARALNRYRIKLQEHIPAVQFSNVLPPVEMALEHVQ